MTARLTMDPGEVELLRGSLRRLLTECAAGEALATLRETGWPELYRDDPGAAAGALFDLQGEFLTGTPALAAVVTSVLDPSAAFSGRVVLPPFGNTCQPPALLHIDGAVSVDGVAPSSISGGSVLVAASVDDSTAGADTPVAGREIVLIRFRPEVLTSTPVDGIDPDLGLTRLRGTIPAAEVTGVDCPDVAERWERAVGIGRQSIAQEIVGNARAALTTAVDHARTRAQFGSPIGSFQAIKHRLADAEVALQVAEVAVDEGWHNPDPFTHMLSKVLAGNAGREVNRQVQQVLGGIGFTWEQGFHRRLRRTIALDSLLGSSTTLQRELGQALITAGTLPDLEPL